MANGEPVGLIDTLDAAQDRLVDVRVHQIACAAPAPVRRRRLPPEAAPRLLLPLPGDPRGVPERRLRPRPEPLLRDAAPAPDRDALLERRVVTGARKTLHPNKIVATFALGTQRLYDWLHENDAVEMLPVDYVNDPRTIAREPRFVSINATTEVDLYGQCASETIAGRYWSSSGGQADFARGAMYSEDGQAFIVLHSTTSRGESRIRVHLSEGSVVTTLKNTVDHVVIEWGIATLRGRSLTDRARALIAIAHPDHRDQLERTARAAGLLGRPQHVDDRPVARV
jgi:acyl-CoA hydrolase